MDIKLLHLTVITILTLFSCADRMQYNTHTLYAWKDCSKNNEGEYYYTNQFGHKISDKRFGEAKQFSPNGLACVKEYDSGKWGYIDKNLNLVIPYNYDFAGSFGQFGFNKNLACVKFNLDKDNLERRPDVAFGPSMIINNDGHRVSKVYGFMLLDSYLTYGVTIVNSGSDFTSTRGFYDYSRDGKWGAIDHNGKEIIPCIYDFLVAPPFIQAFIVRANGKWGLINYNGKMIVECKYDGVIYKSKDVCFNSFFDIDGNDYNKWSDTDSTEDILFISDNDVKKRVKASRIPYQNAQPERRLK